MIRPQDREHWFGRTFREFSRAVEPYRGQPICYVEVGNWKGDSAVWMCENILTHPDAKGCGIDPYENDFKRGSNESAKQIASERLAQFPQWQQTYGKSQDVLRAWPGTKIDLLYLDGSHIAHDVLADFVFAFPYLKKGSTVIFDDWGVSRRKKDGLLRVDVAVDAIRQSFEPFVEKVGEWNTQAVLRITKEPLVGELP